MLSRDAAAGDTPRSLRVAPTSGRWLRGSRARVPILAAVVLAAACGDSPDTPVVPEESVAARILVSPDAISMTALAETREVIAQVFDRGRPGYPLSRFIAVSVSTPAAF